MKNCVAQIMLLSKEQDRAATGVLLGFGKAIKNRNEPEYLSVAICNERQADCVSLEMSKYNWTINIQWWDLVSTQLLKECTLFFKLEWILHI